MAKVQEQRRQGFKTDYNIPMFSYKSAFLLIFSGIVSTLVIPSLLSLIGIPANVAIIICNTLILGYAVAYSRYFIETKKGYCKKFWYTYIFFGIMFGIVSYFWLYLEVYI